MKVRFAIVALALSSAFAEHVHAQGPAVSEAPISTEVFLSAVNQYESSPGAIAAGCAFGSDQPYSTANADGLNFWLSMTASYFIRPVVYNDNAGAVNNWLESGSDWYWADRAGTVMSYFAGHGTGPNGDADGYNNAPLMKQHCTTNSTCIYPPPGTSLPSYCGSNNPPGLLLGFCRYTRMNRGIETALPCSGFSANYSTSAHWGESSYSGSWSGANPNGGANLVGLSISFAEMSNRPQEIIPAFAGMHQLATVVVHTGDLGNEPDRGGAFGARRFFNPNAAVSTCWNDAINGTPLGGGCPLSSKAAGGINGCGAHKSSAVNTTPTNTTTSLAETWTQLGDNTRDPTGANYYRALITCNYDCSLYPWQF